MLHSLARLVESFLNPVALLWVVALVVAVRKLRRRQWRSGGVLTSVVLLTWLVSGTPLSVWLVARLEAPYEVQDWSKLEEADAVLMLGGTLAPSPPDVLKFEVGGTFDRALTALELVRRKKAKVLVISGGGNPGTDVSEVALLRGWFTAWGIPDAPVMDLGICSHTREEAEKTAAMMKAQGWKKIILVTSASHIGRATRVFRAMDIAVIPAACDFSGLNMLRGGGHWHLVPHMAELKQFDTWLHEACGIIFYRMRGWIR